MRRGKLITLEGIDGVGKSTQAEALESFLRRRGADVRRTREPGGVPMGEAIRRMLLEQEKGLSGLAELLLFFAARAEHVRRVVQPALERGQWVVCDRFIDASYAYQGGGREMPFERIDVLAEWVAPGLSPDLTILLDLPPEKRHKEIPSTQYELLRAGRTPDNFESQGKAFVERVRKTYLERAGNEPERFEVIDATRDRETIGAEIIARVTERWPEMGGE